MIERKTEMSFGSNKVNESQTEPILETSAFGEEAESPDNSIFTGSKVIDFMKQIKRGNQTNLQSYDNSLKLNEFEMK